MPAAPTAKDVENALVERLEASAKEGSDETLLKMFKQMSMTLRWIENRLTIPVQAVGMRATSTTNFTNKPTEDQEVGFAHDSLS